MLSNPTSPVEAVGYTFIQNILEGDKLVSTSTSTPTKNISTPTSTPVEAAVTNSILPVNLNLLEAKLETIPCNSSIHIPPPGK